MRNTIYISVLYLLLLFSVGCNDDFLNLAPKDELSEATMFSTYDNCKVFSWGFYENLNPYPTGGNNSSYYNPISWEAEADLIENGYATNGESYLWERINIPATDKDWTERYATIRRANLLLDNVVNASMTDEEKAHWRGVGLFFRSYEYMKLLAKFGGVPWVEHALTDSDTDILFGPRDTRDVVANNILRDLTEAVANVKEEGDGENTVNANVVRALLSRFGLFEGTWRKYHNLGDHTKFLEASVAASEKLISDYPNLIPVYDQIFNSEDLQGKPGIILYRHYIEDDAGYHILSTNTRSTNHKYDVTRKGVDMFLCKDGQTIWNKDPEIRKDAYAEFRDRDTRLLIMSPPPYRVKSSGTGVWEPTEDPADAEWIDEMARVSGANGNDMETHYKILPDRNWSDRITTEVPNFEGLLPTQTATGYRFWKYFSNVSYRTSSRDFNDGPIFRMGEILVNHAEAKYELGEFDQTVADETINKLRVRGEVAAMNVAAITSDFDPTRDPSVNEVLWEIRRERAIELMGEGFRREDLRRWKKMDYATQPKLGRWIKQSDYKKVIPIQGGAAEGYVQLVSGTPPVFPDYYYLFPLPSEELVLNDALDQNPDWE
jgi:hypothetical protein